MRLSRTVLAGLVEFALQILRLPAALIVALVVAIVVPVAWLLFRRSAGSRAGSHKRTAAPESPAVLERAAEFEALRAAEVIRQVSDRVRREALSGELARLETERLNPPAEFRVVVFGTGSSGKTSLINAFLGEHVGETNAVMGTTRHGESHTYTLKGVEGTVTLTDTPGLSEAGEGGLERETEARELAVRSDLLLFVVDHDLIRTEFNRLVELARLGKRSIVILNKQDLFPEADLAAIQEKLRERLRGIVPRDDVVTVSAAPRPTPVRIQHSDGTTELEYEPVEPDIGALRARLADLLRREGDVLHAANLLVRTKVLSRQAQEQVDVEREARSMDVVDRYQWVVAGTAFANPLPVFDLLAGGAGQLEMIGELARVHGITLSQAQVRMLGLQMVKVLLKLGLIEAATSLIAGIFKRTMVGYAAGGSIQAVTMAYLTRISGLSLNEYFRRGQSWGPTGIEGTVLEQFDLTSRVEFLQDFLRKAVDRFLNKVLSSGTQPAGKEKS